jgi:glycosyltransferase involved in cell wall biosynthesis
LNPVASLPPTLRIGISAVTGTQGGPRTYALELLRGLRHAFPEDTLTLFTDAPEDAPPGVGAHRLPLPLKAARPLSEAVCLPWLAWRTRVEVFHGTKQTLPCGLPCARVVSIHDLAPMLRPETFPTGAGAWLRASTAAAAARADRIITGSETTARDLREHLRVPAERIVVTPYGVEDRFRGPFDPAAVAALRARLGLPERYVACVGTIQPRKNVDVVLDAIDLLADGISGGGADGEAPVLALAGRVGWMSDAVVARAKASPRVRWLGEVSDADLPLLLAGATVFVSPSSYEGFGLAIAEAMAAGTAVVGGSGSSLDEVVGDAGLLVPPRDARAVAEAIRALLRDDAYRAERAAAARRKAAAYTWDRTARLTRAVYEEAVAVRREGSR